MFIFALFLGLSMVLANPIPQVSDETGNLGSLNTPNLDCSSDNLDDGGQNDCQIAFTSMINAMETQDTDTKNGARQEIVPVDILRTRNSFVDGRCPDDYVTPFCGGPELKGPDGIVLNCVHGKVEFIPKRTNFEATAKFAKYCCRQTETDGLFLSTDCDIFPEYQHLEQWDYEQYKSWWDSSRPYHWLRSNLRPGAGSNSRQKSM